MSPARSRLSFLFSRVALVGMPMRLRVLIICEDTMTVADYTIKENR
jgi:hypothetical protein